MFTSLLKIFINCVLYRNSILYPGVFVWQESHQVADYTNWYEDEPDNHLNADCVFKGPSEMKWADGDCNTRIGLALCEAKFS